MNTHRIEPQKPPFSEAVQKTLDGLMPPGVSPLGFVHDAGAERAGVLAVHGGGLARQRAVALARARDHDRPDVRAHGLGVRMGRAYRALRGAGEAYGGGGQGDARARRTRRFGRRASS